ncbi:hypothetical protein C3L33_21184, partial [Rhododendron williamsianum]
MDFSLLSDAVASKSYQKITSICDDLMLQARNSPLAYYQSLNLYSMLALGNEEIYVHFECSNTARFLWKSIPSSIKETSPNWWLSGKSVSGCGCGIMQVCTRPFVGSIGAKKFEILLLHSQRNGCENLYTKKMFELLLSAYSTISIQDTALFLGMNEDDATTVNLWKTFGCALCRCAATRLECGPSSRMLTVKKQPVVKEQKIDPNKLQRLTEYVFHLEH